MKNSKNEGGGGWNAEKIQTKKIKKEIKDNFIFKQNKGIFSSLAYEFSHSLKGRILVIPGGYGQEAAQQWREHP